MKFTKRSAVKKELNDESAMSVVDLFAGAGGFSLAAVLTGMELKAAVENNKHAALTYRKNLVDSKLTSAKLFEEDILKLSPQKLMQETKLEKGECDLLVGGPPCQGFSAHRINGAGIDDPRNRLLLRYFEYVRALRPKYFLVENVPGLLWARHEEFVKKFYSLAKSAKYEVFEPIVLNAKDYGVPQSRRRVFILGYDSQAAIKPAWPPRATHVDPAISKTDGRPKWLNAADVFKRRAPKGDINNVHMRHSEELKDAFKRTPHNGGSRSDSGRELNCHKKHDGHSDVYGRIDPLKPGPTMTTACINPSKGRFVHPTEDHGITLRQAARFQAFPDWYIFEGGLMASGAQVGNAVPITMAESLIKAIREAIQSNRKVASLETLERRA